LNFSDPWPKKGHAKRRLTYRAFLALYQQLLQDGGAIAFKTDNRGLFDFSLDEMQSCGFTLTEVTYDLHRSPYDHNNIRTEYENNFSQKGFPIHRVVAYPPKKSIS
jgi:tRNA (guanine-N7-)-methyltransferase